MMAEKDNVIGPIQMQYRRDQASLQTKDPAKVATLMWYKGFMFSVDVMIRELRSNEMHDAADILQKLKDSA